MSSFIENNISTRDEDIFSVNFSYFLVILFDSESETKRVVNRIRE